jgi:hypothetical protein
MTDKHQEAFIPDSGYRLTKNGRSVILGSLSFGRILTPEQNTAFVDATSRYLAAVNNQPHNPIEHNLEIAPNALRLATSEPFYKYVTDEVWNRFIRNGCFQLGSAQYYKAHENQNIRDELEGSSIFHIVDGIDQLNCALVSGLNCALFCGTGEPDLDGGRNMNFSFGAKLIRIELAPFVNAIAKRIGAIRTSICDILYTDNKSCLVHSSSIHRFAAITGHGNLTNMMLRRINKTFFDEFYATAFTPSLLAKPYSYRHERERRIVFELPTDLRRPTIAIEDPSLLQFIQVVT